MTAATRFREWLRAQLALWPDYLVLGAVFAVTFVAVSVTRNQFVPDSQYYYGMALWFGGLSQEDAHAVVAEISARHGFNLPGLDLMFGWGLVQPRVVFPLLAVPFVKVFGVTGLAIVAAAATLALVLVLYKLLSRRYGRFPALSVLVLTMASGTIMFFSTAMLTESLSALWGALALMVAWKYQQEPERRWLIVLGVITAVSAFTRQATFIVAGAFVVAWLLSLLIKRADRRWGAPALVVGATAAGLQILQTLVFPSFSQASQFEKATGTDSLGEAILAAPGLLFTIVRHDLIHFAVNDMALLLLIGLALLSMVLFWNRSESHLLLGALAGLALYNVTNGTPTSFRYAMPGLVFYVASVALMASSPRLHPRSSEPDGAGTPIAASPRS